IWRWAELLPVREEVYRITLGEGDTPLLRLPRLGDRLGLSNLYVKDEGFNPTGTFKARGLLMAVARAVELGENEFVIPTAGNAGSALAAYAARAGKKAHVFMPCDAPRVTMEEVKAYGAELILVDGLIDEAGRQAKKKIEENGWCDVSTFKEPYRPEGKKTMGLELAEEFNWELPDVILYPTGGGTGLVGMWKAFNELETMGWIGSKRPRFVSIQPAGCAPIVRAFQEGSERADYWENAHSIAGGIRVPGVFADRPILRLLKESKGNAVAVSDDEILQWQKKLAEMEGFLASPESCATVAALAHLMEEDWIEPHEKVVLFSTGSGLKYV
ncbi:MAG: threonine synthase, partial [Anaerolineaceae bacterium]|nr:threonine synthase [Anaerolineaceae bacterium]